jgi:hypothetical protein
VPGLPAPTISEGRFGTAAIALAGGFVIAMLFMASYVGALHNPERTPHGMEMAVAGSPRVAADYRLALESMAGGTAFDVRTESSVSAAVTAVLHHDVYAALVPGPIGSTALVVAEASGPGVAEDLAVKFKTAFARAGQPLTVEPVARLQSGDPRGVSPFYVALSWVFAGYLGAIILSALAGAATSLRRIALLRVGGLLVYAFCCALIGTLIVDSLFGALTGHFAAMVGLGTLIVFAVASITSGLQGMFGLIGTALALLLFLIASNPSAGGAVVTPVLPAFWRTIGPWLPTGAATTLVRNTVYFGAHNMTTSAIVLCGYALLGIGLTILAGGRAYTKTERELALGMGAAGAGA